MVSFLWLTSWLLCAHGRTVETIHTFVPPENPVAPPLQANDGNFYVMTPYGGNFGNGSIVKITPAGICSVFCNFSSDGEIGANPAAALIQGSDGFLYGTAQYGGTQGQGTVFRISVAGEIATIYSFGTVENDGANPCCALVEGTDGNLYGTTQNGGTNGQGTVFMVSTAGQLTTLFAFSTDDDFGANPVAGLVQASDGAFYGMTQYGGSAGYGAIFQVAPSGELTSLYSFSAGDDSNDGANPAGPLVQGSDGLLYGVTPSGGDHGSGTIFQISTGGDYRVLYSFSTDNSGNNDGANPVGGLLEVGAGTFYGATQSGGTKDDGVIFRMTPGSLPVTQYSFGVSGQDGVAPAAGLIVGADGNLYGTTQYGSAGADGEVYKLTPGGAAEVFCAFGALGIDGGNPGAGLALGRDGNFYGTTQSGGTYNRGTSFRVTPQGDVTLLYAFGTNANDGATPAANLLLASDGNFYGTTSFGGNQENGTLFTLTQSGELTTLYSFGGTLGDGASPAGALLEGSDGFLYGTTLYGGAYGNGAVFKGTRQGEVSTVYSFGSAPGDGANPVGGLIEDGDGNLYGVTQYGGGQGHGTIFKITGDGEFTTIHSFGSSVNEGVNPACGLVASVDGTLYGTTQYGGAHGFGTVFTVSTQGLLRTLHSFATFGADGAFPAAGLLVGSDGCLYGTTEYGGPHGVGTAYRLTPFGAFSTLADFGSVTGDPANPVSALVEFDNGHLYGAAPGTFNNDGSIGMGTVYRVTLPIAVTDDEVILSGDSPVTINVLANDAGSSSGGLVIKSVTQPLHGRVVINADNTVTYQPLGTVSHFPGRDVFTYSTVDAQGQRKKGEVTVVTPVSLQAGNYSSGADFPGGCMTVTLTGSGSFTGRLRTSTLNSSFKGKIDATGNYSGKIAGNAFTLHVDESLSQPSIFSDYVISGSFGGAQFSLYHAVVNVAGNPSAEAGAYTMLLPAAASAGPGVPLGTGYALLTVADGGRVTMAGSLADGTPFSAGGWITGNTNSGVDQFAFYAGLPHRGEISGTLAFDVIPGVSDFAGPLEWLSHPQRTKSTGGFDTKLPAIGSVYQAPPPGSLALNYAAAAPIATIQLETTDIISTGQASVTEAAGGNTELITGTNANAARVSLGINVRTGMFRGRLRKPSDAAPIGLQGVLFQEQNIGAGFFITPLQSGGIELRPN